ncbi:MAG: anaerobic glycerol-3-phosphate dehydrogenase subunit B [Candidatus Thorarchaeota archaeon]|nr:anaerobic glycerol-3-phosphate dehydrogenase subunit B [Candidatus Thorarchaeota archaeon]
MDLSADVLIIGSGMAGLVAGSVTAEAGLKTIIVTRGHGATADSSGAIDIVGYLPQAGTAVSSPLEGLYGISALYPLHPYSLLGVKNGEPVINEERVVERVRASVDWFLQKMSRSSIPYIGNLKETLWPLTMLGTTKPTALLQESMDPRGITREPDNVLLFVGIRGFPDFHSALAAKAYLEERQTEGTGPRRVANCTVDLGHLGGPQNLSAIEVARFLDSYQGIDRLMTQLSPHIEMSGATHLAIPPVLGLDQPLETKALLEKELRADIIELLGFPPSVPGTRLQNALERIFVEQGGTLLKGHQVVSATNTNSSVQEVIARAPKRSIKIKAQAFILSSGKFIGGGIAGSERGLHETIFDLPVFDARRIPTEDVRPQRLTRLMSITEQGHPLFGCGVGSDETLRPITISGERYASNLFCAGAVLAGHNWPVEKSGLGVALATGYAAGTSVIEEVSA